MAELDYLAHLAAESARFEQVMATTEPSDRVPSCPDWNADDLLWHLGEVQWFWGTIVSAGITSTADANNLARVPRPAGRDGLTAFFAESSRVLGEVLAAAPPESPAWTWAEDRTVGFIRRRQAHEALIHRIDAELTAATRTPMDPALSADGVDEALRVMFGGDHPAWGQFAPEQGRMLRVEAADSGDAWLVTLGRFTGTDPGDGKAYDETGIAVTSAAPAGPAAAAVRGDAGDLDCWLWGRPVAGPLDRSGDPAVLGGFDAVIAAGIG